MIDFLKIKISDKIQMENIWQNPLLYFHSEKEILLFDKETIHSNQYKQHKGLLFELTKYCLYIRFKPHYYFNSNLHNANDFNFYDCILQLKEVINLLNLDVSKCEIVNIEFAVNIILPKELIDVKRLLIRLIFHGQNEFRTHPKYSFCRYSTSANKHGKTNVYKIIKAYAKGIQYPEYTDINTLRFEVKSNRKSYINSVGIFTLKDLLNTANYEKLSNELIKEFDKVLIIDEEAKPILSKTKKKNHLKRLNLINWNDYLQASRNVFNNNVKTYYNDLNTCRTHLKKEIRILINSKLSELKKCADLSIYKDEILPHSKKVCPITGVDISAQKEDSFLLSNTGFKVLEKENPTYYNFLLETLLTGKPNRYEKSIYSKLSKQVRNRYFNNRGNYDLTQSSLF